MSRPKVLLLEASGPESQAVVTAAAAAGIDVHAATHPATHPATHDTYSPQLSAELAAVVHADFTDPGRAVEALAGYAARAGIGAVLTPHEFLTPIAARLAARLGLPGNDPALAAAARDKIDMAGRFAACGVAAPATAIVAGDDGLVALLASGRLTFPLVVKPAENAGSTGVSIAAGPAETITAVARAFRHDRQPHYGLPLDRRVLLQDYLPGTEYSVESVTQHGVSTHLAITRKRTTSGTARVETGHSLPAVLPAGAAARILAEAERAIAAVGIRDSASHTEVMLTEGGACKVIEIAARPGSGQIGFLLQHALGLDPWTACLDLAPGRPAGLAPTRAGYAAVRFLTSPRSGRLTGIRGLPAPGPAVPAVRVRRRVGDHIAAAEGNSARLGHFLVVGTDPEHVDRYADQLLAAVQIDVEAGWPAVIR